MNPRSLLLRFALAGFVLTIAASVDRPSAEFMNGVYAIVLSKQPGGASTIHFPDAVEAYDIVRGDLRHLHDYKGDFAFATEGCGADDAGPASAVDADVPASGEGFWYLVRWDQTGGFPEYGAQSYNGGTSQRAHQVADRDAGIAASQRDCICYYFCCFEFRGQCFFGTWP